MALRAEFVSAQEEMQVQFRRAAEHASHEFDEEKKSFMEQTNLLQNECKLKVKEDDRRHPANKQELEKSIADNEVVISKSCKS